VDLGLFLPTLAVTVRRLHDKDTSGWWVVIPLIGIAILPIRAIAIPPIRAIAIPPIAVIALIGWITLIVTTCRRGTAGANRFGPEFAQPADAVGAAERSGAAS
jgi:uncharacterized membrane protein YhaH (DUF805 family)